MSFDEKTINEINQYMRNNQISNFSSAVNELIGFNRELRKQLQRWKNIAEAYKREAHKKK